MAAATYNPGTNRVDSFATVYEVAIYGSFDPTCDNVGWEDCDWVANETSLSGDIGTPGDSAGNCNHAFHHPSGTDLASNAVLDGITVSYGRADRPNPHRLGGGMVNPGSSPALSNRVSGNNSAARYGGDLMSGFSSPAVADCIFSGS